MHIVADGLGELNGASLTKTFATSWHCLRVSRDSGGFCLRVQRLMSGLTRDFRLSRGWKRFNLIQ